MRLQKSPKEISPGTTNALRERIAYALLGALFGSMILCVVCGVLFVGFLSEGVGFDLIDALSGATASTWIYVLVAGGAAVPPIGMATWGFVAPYHMADHLRAIWDATIVNDSEF